MRRERSLSKSWGRPILLCFSHASLTLLSLAAIGSISSRNNWACVSPYLQLGATPLGASQSFLWNSCSHFPCPCVPTLDSASAALFRRPSMCLIMKLNSSNAMTHRAILGVIFSVGGVLVSGSPLSVFNAEWSEYTCTFPGAPCSQYLKALNVPNIANSSCSVTPHLLSVSENFLLQNPSACSSPFAPLWDTAPDAAPYVAASVCATFSAFSLNATRSMSSHTAFLSASKASFSLSPLLHSLWGCMIAVKGPAMSLNLGTCVR